MKGSPASLRGPHLLADNGHVHGQLIELFAEIFSGRYRTPMPPVTGGTA